MDTIQHFPKGSIIAFVLTDKDGVWIFLIFIDSSLSYRINLIVQFFASQFRQIKTSLTRSGMYDPKAFLSCVCGYHPKRLIIQIMTLILEITAVSGIGIGQHIEQSSWFCLLSLSRNPLVRPFNKSYRAILFKCSVYVLYYLVLA